MTTKTYVKSPCIMVCDIDEKGICDGCYRSAQEIEEWNQLSDDDKRAVLKKTYKRFNAKSRGLMAAHKSER
jgi:predicted Fe-S protein YdhL (DUF1289 family)